MGDVHQTRVLSSGVVNFRGPQSSANMGNASVTRLRRAARARRQCARRFL